MKFAKYIYMIAAVYGILIIFPLYFSELKIGVEYPPAISHPEYFYSFAGVTLVWQILFIFIARNPGKYRMIMLPSILEKMSLLPGLFILYPQGRFPQLWLPLVAIDLLIGVLFFISFKKTNQIH